MLKLKQKEGHALGQKNLEHIMRFRTNLYVWVIILQELLRYPTIYSPRLHRYGGKRVFMEPVIFDAHLHIYRVYKF